MGQKKDSLTPNNRVAKFKQFGFLFLRLLVIVVFIFVLLCWKFIITKGTFAVCWVDCLNIQRKENRERLAEKIRSKFVISPLNTWLKGQNFFCWFGDKLLSFLFCCCYSVLLAVWWLLFFFVHLPSPSSFPFIVVTVTTTYWTLCNGKWAYTTKIVLFVFFFSLSQTNSHSFWSATTEQFGHRNLNFNGGSLFRWQFSGILSATRRPKLR